jgi:hypothetical protein
LPKHAETPGVKPAATEKLPRTPSVIRSAS